MEVDLDALQAMFQHALVTSDLKALAGHGFSLSITMYGNELHITIQDSDTWENIATISIPVDAKTTLRF